MPCGLRCSLAKYCNIFNVELEKCTIGQYGPGLEYTDSGVEVYVDENFVDSTNNQFNSTNYQFNSTINPTNPLCKDGWSMFDQGSFDLHFNIISNIFGLKKI